MCDPNKSINKLPVFVNAELQGLSGPLRIKGEMWIAPEAKIAVIFSLFLTVMKKNATQLELGFIVV